MSESVFMGRQTLCRYNEALTQTVPSPSLHPGRQTNTSDGSGAPAGQRMEVYRFAHTCLKGHYLAGEERFQVEMHHGSGDVWCAATGDS